jgi:hypothetical protein
MAKQTPQPPASNRRRDERRPVATVILVSPNGLENRTSVFDLSASGARIGLPKDFEFGVGAGVRLFFPTPKGNIAFGARIVRVAMDHLGIEFGPGQEVAIQELLSELSER